MGDFRECSPNVSNFSRSFKNIGYNHYSAILDLIDNAVSAGASRIWVDYEVDKKSGTTVIISDNGTGMHEEELFEAMRIASADPSSERLNKDLGKFGLGMKLASFSQTDVFAVVSKAKSKPICGFIWDLNLVRRENKWLLKQDHDQGFDRPKNQGTEVKLIDVFRDLDVNLDQVIGKMQTHIAVAYHKIKGVKFFINDREIEAVDPFFSTSLASNTSSLEKLHIGGVELLVQSHQIPHQNKLKPKERLLHSELADIGMGPGLYIFRKNRLIAWSGWEGLGKNLRINDLYRMAVYCQDDADDLFNIEVKKSQIAITDTRLRTILKASIFNFSDVAQKPYKKRASLSLKDVSDLWELKRDDSERVHFALNKKSDFIAQFKKGSIQLNDFLEAIESTLPYESLMYYLSLNKVDNRVVRTKKLNAARYLLEAGLMSPSDFKKLEERYAD